MTSGAAAALWVFTLEAGTTAASADTGAGTPGMCGIKASASAPALAVACLEAPSPETSAVGLIFHCPCWDLGGEVWGTGLGSTMLLVAAGPSDLHLPSDVPLASDLLLASDLPLAPDLPLPSVLSAA